MAHSPSSFAFPLPVIAALILTAPLSATTLDLYVGSSPGLPPSQGSLAGAFIGGGGQTAIAGGTSVDTFASNAIYAGYSNHEAVITPFPPNVSPGALVNPLFPVLDRTAGFSLDFTFRLVSQVNDGTNGPDRAGFNITLLANDHLGIELGFRADHVFAQSASPLFTADESTFDPGQNLAARDVTGLLSSLTAYTLTVQGGAYALSSGGDTLLTGSVRDYSTATGLGSAAYDTANFLFLGDNTTSARAIFDLAAISVSTIPEPSTFAIGTGLAALALATTRRSRSRGRG